MGPAKKNDNQDKSKGIDNEQTAPMPDTSSNFAAPPPVNTNPDDGPSAQQESDNNGSSPESSNSSSQPIQTVTTSTDDSNFGGRRRKIIMIAIVFLVLLTGVGSASLILNRQETAEETFGWDCTLYVFDVDQSGAVTVRNGTVRDLPAQQAEVYIDGQLAATFDVPALNSGESASLGIVTVPEDGQFSWSVEGNKDCQNSDSYEANAYAECFDVKAFDQNWEPYTSDDLANLEPGEIVRFSVGGQTNQGNFEMARFIINGQTLDPVDSKRPGTEEFYIEFEMPQDVSNFTIDAQLMHSEAGWI